MEPNATCRACNGDGCEKCRNGRVWCTLNCPVTHGYLGSEACVRCTWQRGPDDQQYLTALEAAVKEINLQGRFDGSQWLADFEKRTADSVAASLIDPPISVGGLNNP